MQPGTDIIENRHPQTDREQAPSGDGRDRILAVCDFVDQPGKFERHIGPLARTADVTVVCITPDSEMENVTYKRVSTYGHRPLGLVAMFLQALLESLTGEYDGVVTFSLIPHGCIGLVVARVSRIPVHLGIIGIDLDVHARARYSPIITVLFRRFDAISVPGTAHARQLERLGIDSERVTRLTNAIDKETYQPPADSDETVYDLLWIGRFSSEKDPLLFVEAVSEVVSIEPSVRAAMLGTGPLDSEVQAMISERGLGDNIECPGWVEDPLDYYHRSDVFVLTSNRDALPLTLIEAMATGLGCIVPEVGNIGDVAIDGQNAVVLEDMTAAALASTIVSLVHDDQRIEELGANATQIRSEFSYDRAAEDWQRIIGIMAHR